MTASALIALLKHEQFFPDEEPQSLFRKGWNARSRSLIALLVAEPVERGLQELRAATVETRGQDWPSACELETL